MNRLPAAEGGNPVRREMLPFYRAPVDASDVAAVTEALRSGWLTVGPRTERLERALEGYLGARHVVAVSSCSEAMFLALAALGLGAGDEVITSANTFASTVHAIIHTGARPVLVDIETETFGVDPARVEDAVTPRTRAILPVHFGGQACDIRAIAAIAARHDLVVVEDAAHSFGAEVDGRRLGTFGDATAFSFYATKNLTTGEGGAVSTDDDGLAQRVRRLSYHGMSRDSWSRYTDRGSWYYEVDVPGYKCNMNDMQAALGLSQLARVDTLLDQRTRVAQHYLARLAGRDWLELPRVAPDNRHTWHLFVVRLRPERLAIDRDAFIRALADEGVGSSVHFIPIHRHPFFAPYLPPGAAFPVCEDYFLRCISLPLWPGMTTRDADDVVAALDKLATYYAR